MLASGRHPQQRLVPLVAALLLIGAALSAPGGAALTVPGGAAAEGADARQLLNDVAGAAELDINSLGEGQELARSEGIEGTSQRDLLWKWDKLWKWHKPKRKQDPVCPPPGFDSVADFNLTQYISAPWFVLKQVPVVYQPEDTLYCVRARYLPLNPSNLQEGLLVKNYANKDRVNGPATGTSGAGGENSSLDLNAVPAEPDSNKPTAASKLLVGPAALRRLPGDSFRALYGPYWVVSVGVSSNETLGYDWAIVSGGPPKTVSNDACRTGSALLLGAQVNNDGFWFFARRPDDKDALCEMRVAATKLGYDLSVLKDVQQEGCLYEGAE